MKTVRRFRRPTRAARLVGFLLAACIVATAPSQEAPPASRSLEVAGEAHVSDGGHRAPPNPEFVAYVESLKTGAAAASADAGDGHGRGYAPSPLDLSYLTTAAGPKPLDLVTTSFPSSYDLRALNRVTPVREQGNEGTCWAHATFGSMESCLMPGEARDFSENNLANLHGFDFDGWVLGNGFMSTAYLVRWRGPVDEASDPYPSKGTSTVLPPVKHVQNVIIVPAKSSSTDNEHIKRALTDYGGICTPYYDNPGYYNSTTNAYYYTGTSEYNHLVTIVGWDDSYSRNNFRTAPTGDGAYIVKNSWGTDWSEDGYFYVSYYDKRFAYDPMFVFLAEPTTRYKKVYQHDPLGWIDSWSGSTTYSETGWGANIFIPETSERLGAVGFFAVKPNMSYEISVYTGVSPEAPRSGTVRTTKTGTCASPGYHTIPLDVTVPIDPSQRFSIVVKFTTPGFGYPIPCETFWAGYSSQASASAGQSYRSLGGTTWRDMTWDDSTANICIKGYATIDQTSPTVTINQAVGQADPTSVSPVNFTVVFSEAVTNFISSDVSISGTATGTKTVTVTGGGTTYNVAVGGITGSGTVIAAIAGGRATDAVGNPNVESTSDDNIVTFSLTTIVTSTNTVTVAEGSVATFQVKLSAQPAAGTTVTVAKTAGDVDITVSSGMTLTFTTSNWNSYQPVTLAAAHDADTTNGTATIRCSAPGLANVEVTATEVDDDVGMLRIADFSHGSQRLDFGLQAPEGMGYMLQRSTNLVDWVTVSNVSVSAALSLPRDAQVPMCFFRIGLHPEDCMYLVVDLSGGPAATSYPVRYLPDVPPGGWTDEHKTTKLVLRRIPATSPDFTMGSPSGELGRQSNETQHQVTLTQDFYIGVFEVTQKQWERVMGSWPAYFNNATYRDNRPVEMVSYDDIRGSSAGADWPANSNVDASSFMGKLRDRTGLPLDLPTESQWEYACRAGTTTALNSGYNLTSTEQDARMDQVGRYWYNGPSTYGYAQGVTPNGGTATAGSYLANAWGLYDMHGNVWEWCLDWHGTYPGTVTDPPGASSGPRRVIRGGDWYSVADDCRSAYRYSKYPDSWDLNRGLRACCTPPAPP